MNSICKKMFSIVAVMGLISSPLLGAEEAISTPPPKKAFPGGIDEDNLEVSKDLRGPEEKFNVRAVQDQEIKSYLKSQGRKVDGLDETPAQGDGLPPEESQTEGEGDLDH